jgi:Na+-translocating ferredoxin:NAD+ oxidoreductase subunit E
VGFLIAGKNLIDAQLKKRADAHKAGIVKGNKRVRTTGSIA